MWNPFKNEKRDSDPNANTEETLLTAISDEVNITKDSLLNIPAVAGAVELISSTFAMIPIKLYRRTEDSNEYVKDDIRNILLNEETGDLLTSFEMKVAMCRDYLINGNAYAYIKKKGGAFDGLYYVDEANVSIMEGVDPIFKASRISINGKNYDTYEFVTLLRHTKNGVSGKGILEENKEQLKLMYSLIDFENKMIARGGMKSGFLESDHPLTQDAFAKLKTAWRELFRSRGEKAIVLNQGVKFKEANSTSTELQLNENKKQNSNEVSKMFNIPEEMLSGNVTDEKYKVFIKQTIMPICKAFEKALNRNLLLETEKVEYYFAFDYSDIIKADIKNKFEAYASAIKNGIMTINEVRQKENIKRIDGLDIVSLNLGNVVYDTEENKYFTPNTGQIIDLKHVKETNDGTISNGTNQTGD